MAASSAGIIEAQYSPQHAVPGMAPSQYRAKIGANGSAIAAAISEQLPQSWPRYRIQATIGRTLPAAMTRQNSTGSRRSSPRRAAGRR